MADPSDYHSAQRRANGNPTHSQKMTHVADWAGAKFPIGGYTEMSLIPHAIPTLREIEGAK